MKIPSQPYYQLARNDYAADQISAADDKTKPTGYIHAGGFNDAEYKEMFKDGTPFEYCLNFQPPYNDPEYRKAHIGSLRQCEERYYERQMERVAYLRERPPAWVVDGPEGAPYTPEREARERLRYDGEALPHEGGGFPESSALALTIGGGSLLLASSFASLVPGMVLPVLIAGGSLLLFTVAESSDNVYRYSSIPADEYNAILEARMSMEEKKSELMKKALQGTTSIDVNDLTQYPNSLFDNIRMMAYDPQNHQYIGFDPQTVDAYNRPRWRAEGFVNFGDESLEVYRDSVTVDSNGYGILYNPLHAVYLIEDGNGGFQIYDPRVVSN